MKKFLMVLMVACMGMFGIAGTASAGFSGEVTLNCGDDDFEACYNGYEWEVSFKCEGDWAGDAEVDFDDEEASIDADGGPQGWADCEVDIELESDDDVTKYEAKCDYDGDKVELEVKNKGSCA
jgi:hypothetical protein